MLFNTPDDERIRNAEARSSTLLCSTNKINHLQPAAQAGCFRLWQDCGR